MRSGGAAAARVRMKDLAVALTAQTGGDANSVRYKPDEAAEADFGRYPPLATPSADRMGFAHDASIEALVANALDAIREDEPR